jgi:hypothetical protein
MFCLKRLIICEFIALTAQNADEGFVCVFAVFQVKFKRFWKNYECLKVVRYGRFDGTEICFLFQVVHVYLIRQIAGQSAVLVALCLAKPSSKACLSKE